MLKAGTQNIKAALDELIPVFVINTQGMKYKTAFFQEGALR